MPALQNARGDHVEIGGPQIRDNGKKLENRRAGEVHRTHFQDGIGRHHQLSANEEVTDVIAFSTRRSSRMRVLG